MLYVICLYDSNSPMSFCFLSYLRCTFPIADCVATFALRIFNTQSNSVFIDCQQTGNNSFSIPLTNQFAVLYICILE